MTELTNRNIAIMSVGCFVIVIFIVFVPIITVDTDQPSTLAVCVTQPCEDMVVIKEQKTILEFLSDEGNVELLTRVNQEPDDVGACIQIYQPVCGTDGNTYGNACKLGLSENIDIAHQGEC